MTAKRGNTEESTPLDATIKQKDPEVKRRDWGKIIKYASLIILTVQYIGQVMMLDYSYAVANKLGNKPAFHKSVVLFFNEMFKLSASLALFSIESKSVIQAAKNLKVHLFDNFLDFMKVGVVAVIYLIQNVLNIYAVENLKSAQYAVTYQLKILTTAIFTVTLLGRRLSLIQWISMVVLVAGVALVSIDAILVKEAAKAAALALGANVTTPASSVDKSTSPIFGFACVLTACVLSGFAGIYLEKILKTSDVSIWVRNIQLSLLSIPINFIYMALFERNQIARLGFMYGFRWNIWVAVGFQAFGGLVVAVVMKFADNILKAFSTSVGIVLITCLSIPVFARYPTLYFIGGATLVITAVVVYSLFPYKKPKSKTEELALQSTSTDGDIEK
uniref:UDP-galactose transporter n=1 Tax=Panagrellus redivivus TaxID=6233 RepID=A0A7E4VL61_PANRE